RAVRRAGAPRRARRAAAGPGSGRGPPRGAPADRGRAEGHAAAAERVPVPAALPLRGRAVAARGAAARRDRAGAQGRLLQSRPRRGVGADARGGDGMTTDGAGPLVELDGLKLYFPIKSGIVLDRHVGDVRAVDDVTLTIRRGETLGLVGEFGC